MGTAVTRLNGSPFEIKYHQFWATDDEVWAYLTDHDSKSNIITSSTTCPPGVRAEGCHTPAGLVGGHAYTTIGTMTIQKDGNDVRLVKVRNPWGKEY